MSYTRSAVLPVTPDEAFALITEPERLRRWQTVSARVDLRAGGEYRWTVTPGHVAAGTYREVEAGRRVVFGWGRVEVAAMAGADVSNPQAGSLENRVAVMAAGAIDAWRTRGVEGMVPAPGGGEMSASVGASIMSLEFLLHGWDFAQATGQRLPVSAEVVAYVQTLAEPIIPPGRARGAFAGEIDPADDATPLQRLVAFSVAGGVRVTKDGTSPSTREVTGYSIIEASDLDAALALAKDHPHLNMPGGCEIEVDEAQDIPGM